MRSTGRVALVLILLSLCAPAFAQDPPSESRRPQATPAVRELLGVADSLVNLLHGRPSEELLAAARRALAAAESARDEAGTAYATNLCAMSLENLRREPEALLAWRRSTALWARLVARPELVDALASEALIVERQDPIAASVLVDSALSVASQERSRTQEMGRTLVTATGLSGRRQVLGFAERFGRAAVAALDHADPDSAALAGALLNLGIVTTMRGSAR